MTKSTPRKLVVFVEGAVMAAAAMALSYIPIEAPNAAFDLSLGLIPIAVYSIRRGTLPGVVAGFVWGVLKILIGKPYILSIPQVIFEYPFAFAFAGFAGVLALKVRRAVAEKKTGRTLTLVSVSMAIGVFARWFWHFWAGVIVWGDYAPEGMSPYLYSLLFNGASFLANTAMLIIIIFALAKTAPRLFLPAE
ncbi:MAG: energy-coupled thiamine transporter ThiT [Clostridiales Family XIII bacterium]|jgi:thiamine transporter|nr:energy-coupled thiamine transporter ThiT [Clostridiales Family XIII bacterium]